MDLRVMLEYTTPILTLLIGSFIFYDAKRRKANAEARKAEAENITTYASEWKELYEKKEMRVNELDKKIDSLYKIISEQRDEANRLMDMYRKTVRELKDENAALKMENMKLGYHRCDVKGCAKRQPPSELMN